MARPSNTLLKRFSRKDRSEVNYVVKYLLFGFNILLWFAGSVLIGIGIWAAVQKSNVNNISLLTNSTFDPVSLLIIGGVVIFFIGFFGCIGALRENIPLLIAYMVLLTILLLLLIAAAVIAFAFKDWLKDGIIKSSLQDVIPKYRDDPDLMNLVDWVQSDWLHCCGLSSMDDWDKNIYFNCSSPGVDACGVPYSCCKPDNQSVILNTQCGNGARRKGYVPSNIYTDGCVEAGDKWFSSYIIPIAGCVIGIAVLQILGICCAWSLMSDIRAQKAKWGRPYH